MRSLINPFSVLRHVNLWDVAVFDVGGDAGPDGPDADIAEGMIANTTAPAAPTGPTAPDGGAGDAEAAAAAEASIGFGQGQVDPGLAAAAGLGPSAPDADVGLGDYGGAGFDGGDSGISSVGAGFDSGIGPEVGYDDGMVDPGLAAGIDEALADLEGYTPTSSELDSQLADLGLTNVTDVDPMSVAAQVAQYGPAASIIDDQNLDAVDAQRQVENDLAAAQVLGSGTYDDTILDLVFDETDIGQLKNSDDTNFTGRYRGKSYVDGLESFVTPVDTPTDLPDSYFDIDVPKSYTAGQALTANDLEQLDELGFRGALAIGDAMTFEEAVALSKNANSSLGSNLSYNPNTQAKDAEARAIARSAKEALTGIQTDQNFDDVVSKDEIDYTALAPVAVNKNPDVNKAQLNATIEAVMAKNPNLSRAQIMSNINNPMNTDGKWGHMRPDGTVVSAFDDQKDGGGVDVAGAGFARSGGRAADVNRDGFVSAQEAANVGGLQGNFASSISNAIGATPFNSGLAPTGIASVLGYTIPGQIVGLAGDIQGRNPRQGVERPERGTYTMGGNTGVQRDQDNDFEGEAPEINVCDEGYAFDPVAGMCMPVGGDVPDVPDVPAVPPLRPIEPVRPERPTRPTRPTNPSTPGLNIRPITFNQGGFVTPNIDQFFNRMR